MEERMDKKDRLILLSGILDDIALAVMTTLNDPKHNIREDFRGITLQLYTKGTYDALGDKIVDAIEARIVEMRSKPRQNLGDIYQAMCASIAYLLSGESLEEARAYVKSIEGKAASDDGDHAG